MPHDVSLEGCFPDLAVGAGSQRRVEDGWDCVVLVLDDQLVVRLPRRPEVANRLRTEERVLALLAAHAPTVRAPRPRQTCRTHGSMAYPLLHGAALSEQVLDRVGVPTLAAQVADAVRAVHAVPVPAARAAGAATEDLAPALARFRRDVLPLLDDRRADRLLESVAAQLTTPVEHTLIHADLGPAHLLCDDRGLVAVIDWTDACVGDPARDLAWLLHGLGGRLRAAVVERLDLDPAVAARALTYHRLGPWWEVVHGLDTGGPDLVASGLAGARARLDL